MSYRIVNGRPYPLEDISTISSKERLGIKENRSLEQGESFKSYFTKELNKVKDYKISAHAQERIEALNLKEGDLKKIGDGIEMARNKGSKNTLIYYKDVAFIASVENSTLITAIEKERARENIVTNIDSMVML